MKLIKASKEILLHVNDKIRDLTQTNMSPEHYFEVGGSRDQL